MERQCHTTDHAIGKYFALSPASVTWYFPRQTRFKFIAKLWSPFEHFGSFPPITLWFWRYAYPWFLFRVQVSRFPFRIRFRSVALNLCIVEPIYLGCRFSIYIFPSWYWVDFASMIQLRLLLIQSPPHEACIYMLFALYCEALLSSTFQDF